MEIIRLAIRNLVRRPVRTALTVLGVTIAIAFTVALLSISEGFVIAINQSTARQGEHIVVLPEETGFQPAPMLETYGATFSQEAIDKIVRIENVKAVYPVFTRTLMPRRELAAFLSLNGVTSAFLTDLRPYLKVERGRLLRDSDKDALVIGAIVATQHKLDMGSKLDVQGRELEVVGVLRPSGGILEDMISYLPLGTAQELFGGQGKVTLAAVTVKDLDRAEATAKQINGAVAGVKAQTSEELMGVLMDFVKIARSMHLGVASIALLIGILFVLSTMIMAVSERVKEIGTMRAIGASRGLVFRLIMSESVIIGAVAGGLGCLGGYLLSRLITFGVAQVVGVSFLQTAVTPRIFATGIVTALLIGTVAGLYPAWRIARANIVGSLRHE
ncbi:MAG: ABC transporter permease [Chloroflexi bacterium]|nr:ABC transporter permease [Chloroflexota bacterium]